MPTAPSRRRTHFPSLACSLALLAAAGCGVERTTTAIPSAGPTGGRIVLLTNATSPFWDAAERGGRDAADALDLAARGLRFVIDKNTGGASGQIEQLKQYRGAGDVAALALSVADPNNPALIDAIRDLRESGVPVVVVDSDVHADRPPDAAARFGYIGSANFRAGELAGQALAALKPGGGPFGTFVGYKSQGNAVERNAGVTAGAASVPGLTAAEFLGDDVDRAKARKNVRDFLDRHPDAVGLVGLWSYNPPAIVDVVNQLGVREKLAIVGFDAEPPTIAHLADGDIDALFVQNPYAMGREAVTVLADLLAGEEDAAKACFDAFDPATGGTRDTGLKVVVPDRSPLTAADFDPAAEFMTLPQFRAWLSERGLEGS